MPDTTITVPADSLAAATEGTRRGERWTANPDCGTVVLEISNGEVIARPLEGGAIGRYPPLSGWTRADPLILCPRCGNQLDVYDNGGGAAPWCVDDCDCGEKLPAYYESRDKLAAGIASLRTPWHRPTERPEGGEQWLVVWADAPASGMKEYALWWRPREPPFSTAVLAWRYTSAPPWVKEART